MDCEIDGCLCVCVLYDCFQFKCFQISFATRQELHFHDYLGCVFVLCGVCVNLLAPVSLCCSDCIASAAPESRPLDVFIEVY